MKRNRLLAVAARKILGFTFHVSPPSPDGMIGAMTSIPLPEAIGPAPQPGPSQTTPWQDLLLAGCKVEVPIVSWPSHPKRLVRVSAQLYNHLAQYELLSEGIRELLDDQM